MRPSRMAAGPARSAAAGEARPATPASGFRTFRSGRIHLWVDAALADAALALGLLEVGGFERLLARGSGSPGRGPTAVEPLPGRCERLHLRGLHRGGWLAKLGGDVPWGWARATAELHVTAQLERCGAPVPRAALVVGRQRSGPVWRSAVGTLFEEETCNLAQLLSARVDPARRRRALDAVADALRRFHDAGGLHPDLHAGNILVREGSTASEALVVDLDGARVRQAPGPGRRMAELMRLYRSLCKLGLAEHLDRADSARFLSRYTRRDREQRRALLSSLPRERARLQLHALGWRIARAARAHPGPRRRLAPPGG